MDRQAAAVPDARVTADLDLAADVGGNLATEVTLDLEMGVEVLAQSDDVIVTEVAGAQVGADARCCEGFLGAGTAYTVDVGERDLHPLLAGEVDAGKSCHPGGSPGFSSSKV